MTLLQITSLLIVLAGAFGAINYLFLKLPSAIGILIVSLLASFVVMLLDLAVPALGVADVVRDAVLEIEFSDALLEGMLGLLLFAGALHVKLADLKREWVVVALMATIGIALSTTIVGSGFSWLTGMPLLVALVFGALISPTDPVESHYHKYRRFSDGSGCKTGILLGVSLHWAGFLPERFLVWLLPDQQWEQRIIRLLYTDDRGA